MVKFILRIDTYDFESPGASHANHGNFYLEDLHEIRRHRSALARGCQILHFHT